MRPKRKRALLLITVVIIFIAIFIYLSLYDNEMQTGLGFSKREAKLAQRVREVEEHNDFLRKQLSISRYEIDNLRLKVQRKGLNSTSKHQSVDCAGDFNLPRCMTLHIAIVCAGQNAARDVVTLLKSVLFYRTHPLHFHFVSDENGQQILTKLFKSWQLHSISLNFYPTSEYTEDLQWIPNKHYSGVYGLMKLILPSLLPDSLEKVIVLDTDILFMSNVAELWNLFSNFNEKQCVGLVENQSDWYLGKIWKNHRPWPALGRGFNTGVILLHLKRLRDAEWNQMWRLIAERELLTMLSTPLADQDIFNAVLKENSELVLTMPCQWNVQLSEHTKSDECYRDLSDLKVIHWNSPLKQHVDHKHIDFFRNAYLTFLQYDGYLLRRGLFACNDTTPEVTGVTSELDPSDDCYEFHREQHIIHRTHIFYFEYEYTPLENDVTLVVQLSSDRLQTLEPLASQWPGPISATVYVYDAELHRLLEFYHNSEHLQQRRNIGLHVVFKTGNFYPINLLRNVAIGQVATQFMFLCDVDFLPMPGLYEYVRKAVAMFDFESTQRRPALVVPAFEVEKYKFDFPANKLELLSMLDLGSAFPFRYNEWPQGHAPTDFSRWRSATTPYRVEWQQDFEPYVIVPRDAPRYDTRFVGFGWNKVSHIMQLDVHGFDLMVLPGAFIVHLPHAPSLDISKYRSSDLYRFCLKELKIEFQKDLSKKYGIAALKYLQVDD